MKIGALTVTTGLSRTFGVAALLSEVRFCNGSTLYDPRLSMLLHLVEDTHSVRDAYAQFSAHLNREAQALYGKFFSSLVEVT